MLNKMLASIEKAFPLTQLDPGEFGQLKINGMHFHIRCFYAEGLGHVSAMEAVGFFGLMKMDTLVVNPFEKDMPLFSHDRIRAMGKDSLYLELYNTMLETTDLSPLDQVVQAYRALPAFDPGAHWYDPIKLPQSLFKRGKKLHSAAFTAASQDFLDCYLQICRSAPACDSSAKREKAAAYSEGLLANGGPAADVFIKRFGKETTGKFFRNIFFGA